MPVQPCPACGRTTPKLQDDFIKYALVNYYRCEGCGHVWTTDRVTGAIVKHVTPLPEKKRPPE
jgi:hypothetical protein